MSMTFVFGWLLWSIAVAAIASSRGRSAFLWFLLSLLLSPLLTMILVLAFGRPGPNYKTHKRCPDCRELILMDAVKCKHCGTALARKPAGEA